MIQEDKNLLLKYLCMALPYGVKIMHTGWDCDSGTDFDTVETLIGIDDKFIYTVWDKTGDREKHCLSVSNWKPYLRPMSSMTGDELKELKKMQQNQSIYSYHTISMDLEFINWYLAHHFDINHLIQRGLAIEVTEENNPYK